MKVVPILAALGDESRLQIVMKLCRSGPQSIAKLAEGAAISRQGVTKHLHALHEAGLLRSERRGRERIWRLEPKRLDDVRRYLARISQQWDDALSRLRSAVEE
ncbi:MAG TPA: metalloregulator ArsR/SmtB family transcription factor [Candidatus Babeliales bacterium]|nr:metalloregulator ArsR/SmtB family transcription factor [Candidatus Babeliales bacterium]